MSSSHYLKIHGFRHSKELCFFELIAEIEINEPSEIQHFKWIQQNLNESRISLGKSHFWIWSSEQSFATHQHNLGTKFRCKIIVSTVFLMDIRELVSPQEARIYRELKLQLFSRENFSVFSRIFGAIGISMNSHEK